MSTSEPDTRGEGYEAQHVHSVYEEIASHFSSTRYKPWPIVERFLKGLPDGAVGADVGCGNGKYLAVNPGVFIVGSDRSTNLVKIATQHQPHSAIVADNLSLPHPPRSLDFAISIAVIHHLSTPERRIEAVQAVLDLLKNGGKALIYVWALEQKDSRRGWDEGHEQDVMVPWVMKMKKEKEAKEKKQKKRKGEAKSEIKSEMKSEMKSETKSETKSEVPRSEVKDGEEAVAEGKEEEATPKDEEKKIEEKRGEKANEKTFLRYYHLYRKGELEHDIEQAGGTVLETGYEKDNWWAIATPGGKS